MSFLDGLHLRPGQIVETVWRVQQMPYTEISHVHIICLFTNREQP
jgi:hypothetical protein